MLTQRILLRKCYKIISNFLVVIVFIAASNFCKQLWASEVKIIGVDMAVTGKNQYRFAVTLLHEDAGWNHYANKWEIRTLDDEVLGTRVLGHPHVKEQPFTRSLFGVQIPSSITQVKIVAFDSLNEQSADRVVILKK